MLSGGYLSEKRNIDIINPKGLILCATILFIWKVLFIIFGYIEIAEMNIMKKRINNVIDAMRGKGYSSHVVS